MGCIIVALLLLGPRVALIVIALSTTWISTVYKQMLLPVLLWVFLPWTMIFYIGATLSEFSSTATFFVVVFGVLLDLGSAGTRPILHNFDSED